MRKFMLLVSVSLLLGACGWQLRGSQGTIDLDEINLSAVDIYTPLYRSFQQECERRRIKLVSHETAPRLQLVNELRTSRIVSYNTELDPAEDEITLTINYRINDQPFEVRETQTYQRNKNRAAARENERDILIKQMRTQLVGRVLRQMALIHHSNTGHP